MPIGQLLILFKSTRSAPFIPRPSPFVGLRCAPASSRTGPGGMGSAAPLGRKVSWFANYRFCPGLLHPRQLIVRGVASSRPCKAAGATRNREIRDRFGKIGWNGMSLHVEEKHVPIGCGKRKNSCCRPRAHIDDKTPSKGVVPEKSCLALCDRTLV